MKKQTVEEKIGRTYAHFKSSLELHEEMVDLLCAVNEYQENHRPPKCENLEAALRHAWGVWERFDNNNQEDMELAACQMRAEMILENRRERAEHWRKEREKWQAKQAKAKKPKADLAKAA